MLVAAANLPFLAAASAGGGEDVFTGLLLNPVDGASYLAKMRQGWAGSWTFTLPYTAEPGAGAFVYTYYLALGHLARGLGLSLISVYHLARVVGGVLLLLTAGAFMARCFESPRARLAAWLLFAAGSGLGWLAVPAGAFTADLHVAEAFPFLALITNAHFALTQALLLWIVMLALPDALRNAPLSPPAQREWLRLGALALAAVAVAQVQPLALLNAALILGSVALWQALTERSARPLFSPRLITFGLAALPWLVYGFWLTRSHPVLREWNAQNLTPSPPVWNALLSGGLPLLLALFGLARALRERGPRDRLLALWLLTGVAALYAPFALQRRLALGLWISVCVLAVTALRGVVWPRLRPRLRPLALGLLGLMVVPSNLLVFAAAFGAVAERNPIIFLTAAEAQALAWLDHNGGPGALVAASPEMGLYLPAWAGARVLYGHPFETIRAAEQRAALEAFFAGPDLSATFVEARRVNLVLLGPRERALGAQGVPASWRAVYDSEGVAIYAPD
jgi:hypothetical protein